MSKKYSEDDIRKGFRNLAKLKQKTVKLEKEVDNLKEELAVYQAKEVGQAMVKMGYNNDEANAAISMLKRLLPN
jgi:Holliday junction resolvasome RuvABC DNA-binding subunit